MPKKFAPMPIQGATLPFPKKGKAIKKAKKVKGFAKIGKRKPAPEEIPY
jgi:hypothetical protein